MRNAKKILELIKKEDQRFSSYQLFRDRAIFHDIPFLNHEILELDTFVISVDLAKDRIYFYLRSHLEIKKINEIVPVLNLTEWENNLFVYHISQLTDLDIAKLYILLVKLITNNLSLQNKIEQQS